MKRPSGISKCARSWLMLMLSGVGLGFRNALAVGDSGNVTLEVHDEGTQTLKDLYRSAREDVLDALSDGSETCDNWRKTGSQLCKDAQDCGKGWLFRQQQLLLVIPELETGGLSKEWIAGESRNVTVVGLKDTGEDGDGEQADCDASNLAMLLRLQGPEALAEAAVPETGRCAWNVQFRPSRAGDYTLDVTLVDWKGFLEPHVAMCNMVPGAYGEGSVKLASVPAEGGPFFGAHEGCCSLCTRLEGCVAWSATDQPNLALVDGERCVMYSSVVGDAVETAEQRGALKSGTSRDEESMTYLGPSMDMGRSWCAERNARVLGSGHKFAIADGDVKIKEELPLCTVDLLHEGRWVSIDDSECDSANWKGTADGWPNYNTHRFGAKVPEECFLHPDKPISSGAEHAQSHGYVYSPYDCRYDLLNTEDRMQCLTDLNVTRLLDFGDSLITTSRMPRTALFLPKNAPDWSTGKGRPQIASGAKSHGCSGPQVIYYGHDRKSGTHYCGAESWWQLPVGSLKDLILRFSPDVVLANWALVHRLWHGSLDDLEGFRAELSNSLDEMEEATAERGGPPRFMFWMPIPFLVSEREPHCVEGRAHLFNVVLREQLEPRGWIEVNWPAMTRKWALDIPDGMHHGPSPTRMLAYLLMHQICHGYT